MKLALHKMIIGKLCVFLMYMYSWDMKIWCPNNLWCSNFLPPYQQGTFFFRVERIKILWHDYSNSSNHGNRTWTKCESINPNYLPNGRNFGYHINLLCHEVGRAKRSNKLWCETIIVCTGKNILPNDGIMWKAIERPRRYLLWFWTLYRLGMTSWLGKLAF